MAKIKRYTKADGGYHGELEFMCPGCKCRHFINDNETELDEPTWGFNKDFERPTITPSVLVQYPVKGFMNICHSFIKNGQIQFLPDCTHELAGQTVELPEIE